MEALYCLHLSLPAASWVNPTLLFFDRIGVITPDAPSRNLFDEHADQLISESLVRPVSAADRPQSQKTDDRFVGFLCRLAGKIRESGRIERLHVGNLAYSTLGEDLTRAGLLIRTNENWFEAPAWVAAHIISYFAIQLADRDGVPLLTDELSAGKVVAGESVTYAKVSRRIKAVTALLPVRPSAKPDDIFRFRDRHRQELHTFRDFVTELAEREAFTSDGERDFDYRLVEAKRVRDHIETELRGWGWGGAGFALTISAASIAAPMVEGSLLSAAANVLPLGCL